MGCNSMFSLCSACYCRSARVFTICVKENYRVLSDTGFFQNLKTCDQFSCCRFLICENCLLKLNIFEKISLGCLSQTPYHRDAYYRMQDLPSPTEDVPEAHSPKTNCSCETCRKIFGGLNLLADVVDKIEKSPEHGFRDTGSQPNVFAAETSQSKFKASPEEEFKSGRHTIKRQSSESNIKSEEEQETDTTHSKAKRYRASEQKSELIQYIEEKEHSSKITEEPDITSKSIEEKDIQSSTTSGKKAFSSRYFEESDFGSKIAEEKKVHSMRFSEEREIRSKFTEEKGFISKFNLEKSIQSRKPTEETGTTSKFTEEEIQSIQFSEKKGFKSLKSAELTQHPVFLNEPSTSSGIRGRVSPKSSKTMNCEHCGKSFTHRGDLNKHLRSHTGEQPYECHVCQRKFTHTSNLARHLRVHSGDRPFHCDRCNRDFGRKDKLIMHQKTKLCMKLSQQQPERE